MFKFNTIEEAIADLRLGRQIIVSDDEDREDEGDLIAASQFATAETVNFMASYGKGLICMPISMDLCQKLELPQMVSENSDNHGTAFTVSIDYVGTTTGISAAERAQTARICTEDNIKPQDLRRPGHMFPLMAKSGGVLERGGHTEATVDLMRLAGLKECGLCCEIMNNDGTMMRLPDLIKFSQKHDLKFITIKSLQDYIKRHEKQVKRISVCKMPTRFGEFTAYGYINSGNNNGNISGNGEHHVALVKGDIEAKENILCRIHSECLTGDAFGSLRCDCGQQFAAAMTEINQEGCGIVLYMRQEGRGIGLVNKLRAYELQDKGLDTLEANQALGFAGDLREYHLCAAILKDLGVKSIRLMTNNPDKINALQDCGISVVSRVPLQMKANEHDLKYLKTKQAKMGHILNY